MSVLSRRNHVGNLSTATNAALPRPWYLRWQDMQSRWHLAWRFKAGWINMFGIGMNCSGSPSHYSRSRCKWHDMAVWLFTEATDGSPQPERDVGWLYPYCKRIASIYSSAWFHNTAHRLDCTMVDFQQIHTRHIHGVTPSLGSHGGRPWQLWPWQPAWWVGCLRCMAAHRIAETWPWARAQWSADD